MAYLECRYCGTQNEAEENRCVRCNRRLQPPAPRPAPAGPRRATAAAPVFESLPGGAPERAAEPEKNSPDAARQPLLFPSLGPKVIPIPTLTPLRPPSRDSSSVRRGPRAGGSRSRRGSESQGAFELSAASSPGSAIQVDVIYCDAPVALPAHRAMAAAVDASFVLVALGLFLGIFVLAGGEVAFDRQTTLMLAGVAVIVGIFYRLLWWMGDGDSIGMRFAGLRLVDFDGRRPTREQRGLRQAAGLLSVFSAGLGLVWALVDEENLTWHDHISKTFPTPG